ncbi:hypothetical protein KI387_010533, partial [Taxus chinensis]
NPTPQLSNLISRSFSVNCCQGNGACLGKGARFHKEQRPRKLSSSLVACIISITAISTTQESLAQILGSQQGGTIFQKACIGCHYEGGNVLQPGATLTTRDLERNGIVTIADIFNLTYYGKGRMPSDETLGLDGFSALFHQFFRCQSQMPDPWTPDCGKVAEILQLSLCI